MIDIPKEILSAAERGMPLGMFADWLEEHGFVPAPFTWNGRTCKVEEGCWCMSAVGNPDDWDYARDEIRPRTAVAGTAMIYWGAPAEQVALMFKADEDKILLVTEFGKCQILEGDPMVGGRITCLEGL